MEENLERQSGDENYWADVNPLQSHTNNSFVVGREGKNWLWLDLYEGYPIEEVKMRRGQKNGFNSLKNAGKMNGFLE